MKSKDNKTFDVSIIIPTKNEEGRIESCLKAITKQATNYTFEIIIVDTNSSDNTVSIAKKYDCKIIQEKTPGRNFARIAGANMAKGTILCFTEADCIVPNDWIQKIVDLFGKSQIIGFVGTYSFINSFKSSEILRSIFMPIADHFFRIIHGYYPFRASNCAIRTDTYHKVGGISRSAREFDEIELSMRASKEGVIRYVSAIKVLTDDRRIRNGIFKHIRIVLQNYVRTVILKQKISEKVYEDIR